MNASAGDHIAWRLQSLTRWDGFGLVIVGAYLVAVLLAARTLGVGVVSVGVCVVAAAAYLLVGRPGFVSRQPRRVAVFFAVLIVCTAIALVTSWAGSLALFLTYGYLWYFTSTWRSAVAWTVALLLVTYFAAWIARDMLVAQDRSVYGWMAATTLLSLPIGLWINHVAHIAHGHAVALDQLRLLQDSLRASERQAGTLTERARMAQEIHDTVVQGFVSTAMLSEIAAESLARSDWEAVRERLAQIETVARDNLAEARSIAAATGPATLRHTSLDQAVRDVALGFSQRTGVSVDVAADACAVGEATAEAVLRSVQEVLSNVERHAAATTVQLRLAIVGGRVVLEAQDNGRGIPVGVSEGQGLSGIRSRARTGGGTVDVNSSDAGTRVTLRLPARAEA